MIHAAILWAVSRTQSSCGNPNGQAQQRSSPGSPANVGEILPKRIEVSVITPKEMALIKEKNKIAEKNRVEKKERSKDGYWGVGIYTDVFDNSVVFYNGGMYAGMRVKDPIDGNPAQIMGLQKGDIIFMIDNMPLSDKNNVRGDGPRHMVLHVKRGEFIFTVPIERDWIETRKSGSP